MHGGAYLNDKCSDHQRPLGAYTLPTVLETGIKVDKVISSFHIDLRLLLGICSISTLFILHSSFRPY